MHANGHAQITGPPPPPRAVAADADETHAGLLRRIVHGETLEESVHAITRLIERATGGLRCELLVGSPVRGPAAVHDPWTVPVIIDSGEIAGSVRGRPSEPRHPSSTEREQLELAAGLATLVVERHRGSEHHRAVRLCDPLTGLPGRAQLLATLNDMVDAGRPPALLFCNVDRFKLINDSLGPTFGDRVLSTVAARIRAAVRTADIVARLGGDEFVVLVTDAPGTAEIEQLAQRIIAHVGAPMAIDGRTLVATVSLGAALPHADDAAVDLLRRGNLALSQAKRRGHQRYVVRHRTANDEAALRQLELETGIRDALQRDELRVHFQPIVRCENKTTALIEALVRWQHPHNGLVPPDAFLPAAEQGGLLDAVDRWVLHEACRQVAANRFADRSSAPAVSVNFAGLPFEEAELVTCVLTTLRTTGLPPEQLVIEVTEDMLATGQDATLAVFEQLRSHGIRIAIDDFGTGYSSLHRLRTLPVDILKVDRSFVSGLGDELEASALLEAIVTMGHALGMEIVAEGVETDEQFEEVTRLGCDMAQGFLFARPAPLSDLDGACALADRCM